MSFIGSVNLRWRETKLKPFEKFSKNCLQHSSIKFLSPDQWIMNVGGVQSGVFSPNVELFNVKTGRSCKLAALPVTSNVGPLGMSFQGSPLVCGGHVTNATRVDIASTCYKFQQGSWVQVRKNPDFSIKFIH